MMKNKVLKIITTIVVLLVVVVISYSVGYINGQKSIFEEKRISPSGLYELELIHGYDRVRYIKLVISKTKNNEDSGFACDEQFSARHNIYIEWGESDRLWIYSGDIGIYFWEHKNDKWIKVNASDENICLAPDKIQENYN